jgi:PAS domain-containing protein
VRIALCGLTDLAPIVDAVNEGLIDKFLTKPWDQARLREHIAQAFRQKELADDNRRLAKEIERASASYASLDQELQKSVIQQGDHANLLERGADGARQILDSVPVAIIGVDSSGLIVYVNGDAGQLLPQACTAVGGLASDALPEALLRVLGGEPTEPQRIQIGARQYFAAVRTMDATGVIQGRLLVLLAVQTNLQEVHS